MDHCDFCNALPLMCYLAKPASMLVAGQGKPILAITDEHWRACRVCIDMIDNDQRWSLAKRAHEHAGTSFTIEFVYIMHQTLFWKGNPVKHGPAHGEPNAEEKGH